MPPAVAAAAASPVGDRPACGSEPGPAPNAACPRRPAVQLPEPLTGKTVKLSEYAAGAPATLVMHICNHCPFVVHLKPAMVQLAADYQAKGVKVRTAPDERWRRSSRAACRQRRARCACIQPGGPRGRQEEAQERAGDGVVCLHPCVSQVLAISSNSAETHPKASKRGSLVMGSAAARALSRSPPCAEACSGARSAGGRRHAARLPRAPAARPLQTLLQDGPDQMAADAKAQGYPFPYLYDQTQDVAKAYTVAWCACCGGRRRAVPCDGHRLRSAPRRPPHIRACRVRRLTRPLSPRSRSLPSGA